MNMQIIKSMSDEELLDLFSDMVRSKHYEPGPTPKNVQEIRDAGISTDDLHDEIISRMAK